MASTTARGALRHAISILVDNKPGVLTRVSALFSRRGFNIHSVAVGPTEHPEVSRMTVVVTADHLPFEQVTKQLNKLVNVIKIVELEDDTSIQRKLMLVKVRADGKRRSGVIEVVNLFRARVIDVNPETVIIETTGSGAKAEAMLTALEPYGIEEIVQSGTIGIGRGPRSMTDQLKEK